MNKVTVLALCLMAAVPAAAEQAVDREQDLFGASTPTTPEGVAGSGSPGPAVDKFVETLQIGGSLSNELDYYLQDAVPLRDDSYANPNILFLYLDSKLENDSRIFARGRLFYDPTGASGGTTTAGSLSKPYGTGVGTSDNLKVSLQELRISANVSHRVFFTLGRQKVKFGAAKFFNPTDFLNSQAFNFFLPSDERPGVDMAKMHVPLGAANLYAMGLTGNPSYGNPSGGYFRAELPYDGLGSWLGSGEASVSGFFPHNQAGKAGFDISQAVGDLDLYFEGAAGQDPAGDWKDAISSGGSWDIRYGDRSSDVATLQAEYFQAGTLAEYGVFSLFLSQPWGWTYTSFVETNLYNFLDHSGLSRLGAGYQFTTQLHGSVYAAGHWGELGGVFRLPGQMAETGARLDVSF